MGNKIQMSLLNYTMGTINKASGEKDLGSIIQDDQSIEEHINKTVREVCKLLTNIKVAVYCMLSLWCTFNKPSYEYMGQV